MNESQESKAWSTTELARAAGVNTSYIRQLLLADRIEGYKLARDWRIPDNEARRWLSNRGVDVDKAE
jgi:hypothetical protein